MSRLADLLFGVEALNSRRRRVEGLDFCSEFGGFWV